MNDYDGAKRLRERLQGRLRAAMKERDKVTTSALRVVLNAVDHAGAVELDSPEGASASGRGAEVPRRLLDDAEVEAIVRLQIEDRRRGAEELEELGRAQEATRLRAEAAVMESVIP